MLACALAALGAQTMRNAVTTGEFIVEPPTLICLGFEWKIEGDNNRNANVSVHYRRRGEKTWREALPLLRIGDEQSGIPAVSFVTPRMFAGSILDLDPDTEYEYRLVMSDPDGVRGKAVREGSVRTRGEPKAWIGGRIRHVYPLDYRGKREEPFYPGLMQA